MQKYFVDHFNDVFNMLQINLSSIKIVNPPLHSLIKAEIHLVDNKCTLLEDKFLSTRCAQDSNWMTIFESETKEITSARTDFRDIKFLKLPNVTKQSEYKNFNLLIIVKIGTCNDTNS